MKTILLYAILVLSIELSTFGNTVRSSSHSEGDGIQMRIEFHGRGFGSGNGSCTLGPDNVCEGMAWIGNGSGFSLGSLAENSEVREADFELIFSFTYDVEDGRPYLLGTLYSLDIAADGTIASGKRQIVHEPINFGESHRVTCISQRSDRQIEMEYVLEEGSIESSVVYGSRTLTLSSFNRLDSGHTLVSQTIDLYDSLAQALKTAGAAKSTAINFESKFVNSSANGQDIALAYRVNLSFAPPLDPAQPSQHTELTLQREYLVDSAHQAGARLNAKWITGYAFVKSVDIAPGKALKLVFPPNLSAVPGFQIEDTLTIVP